MTEQPDDIGWFSASMAKKDAEIERLRAALMRIACGEGHEIRIAREALDRGLPTAADVRGILNEQLAPETKNIEKGHRCLYASYGRPNEAAEMKNTTLIKAELKDRIEQLEMLLKNPTEEIIRAVATAIATKGWGPNYDSRYEFQAKTALAAIAAFTSHK